MARTTTRIRRAGALLACIGLATALTACDGDGSASRSGAGSTPSTARRHPRRSTTTSSSGATSTSPTTTTAPTGQTGPGGTNPPPSADCGTDVARFTAVVEGGDLSTVPVERYTVTDCRLSPTRQIWGAVTLVPKPGETVPPLTVVFERIGSL